MKTFCLVEKQATLMGDKTENFLHQPESML
jgi:hypothetical protein